MEVRMVNGSSGDLLDRPVFFQANVPGKINLARAPRPYHLKQLIFSKENGVRECAPPFFQYHLSGIILIQFFLIYNSCLSKFPKNFLKIELKKVQHLLCIFVQANMAIGAAKAVRIAMFPTRLRYFF